MKPKQKQPNVLTVIERIRDSTPYMHVIFTSGSCWHFYKILKAIFPDAQPYYMYDDSNSHVITKIGEKFYDITGEVDYAHRAKPFDERHFPGCTKYRERWWCKFYTLAREMENIVMRKKDRKKWPL